MSRKLASIQKILDIQPIPNADSIEVAQVLGWRCVVKKGDFKVGDKAVYFEVDSFLPIRPEFEFLRKCCLKKLEDGAEGFRLRTVRLRGQISQGLLMPMSLLDSYHMDVCPDCEGMDITEELGVRLWQPPIPADLKGEVKGQFPSFIMKTDETRVQVLGEVLKRYASAPCYVTEKIDGTSVTFYLKDGEFGVCSRNLELRESAGNAYWQAARELDIESKLRKYGRNIAIQGELFGHGIQDNPLKHEGRDVYFFNVFDIDRFLYYPYSEFIETIGELGLKTVPVLEVGWPLDCNIDALLSKAIGKSVVNPKCQREGIVIRPLVETMDLEMSRGLGSARLSFKAINQEYLLAEVG